LAIYWSRNDG
jgi:hypothetical protein